MSNVARRSVKKRISVEKSSSAIVWHNKGVDLAKLGKYEEAIACYDKALEIDPKDESAWYNKGVDLAKLGKYEEAIACYDKALEINPKKESAWCNKGWTLGELGKYEEAIACYDKALEIDPKKESAWYNKGIDLGELGKYEEAIVCYDKALEINPKKESAWYNKGIDLGELGKYEEAIACYDKALEINPKKESAWYAKGFAYGLLRKFEYAPSVSKSVSEGREIELTEIVVPDLPSSQKLRVSLVQLEYTLTQRFPPKVDNISLIQTKILSAIDTAKRHKVNAICFPELSFSASFLKALEQHKDIIIIGGSYYDANNCNVCPVVIKGYVHLIRKLHPAPTLETEIISGKGMVCGTDVKVFTTQDKTLRFGVLICLDYLEEIHKLCNYERDGKRGVNLVFNPCYNPNPHRIQSLATSVCENYHIDTLQANRTEERDEYGGTCIIGRENKDNLSRLKSEGLKPDDDITYKLCEAKGETMIIADLDLKGVEVPIALDARPRIKIIAEYSFRRGKWKETKI